MSGRPYARQRTSPPIGGETPRSQASSLSPLIDNIQFDEDHDIDMGDGNNDRDHEGTHDPNRMDEVEELEIDNNDNDRQEEDEPEAQDTPMPPATQPKSLKPIERAKRAKRVTIIHDEPSSPG